ncbi:cell division protein ZipA [Bdellovibrio sp. qaytius]|nr:cell division protein ZipA [Bdellovibrio sp. qaytius]
MIHFLCGKIASGKSTLAARLASQPNTILLSEDKWLYGLYPHEIKTIDDYAKCSQRLREVLSSHILNLLKCNLNLVLDFPANTLNQRAWFKSLLEQSGVEHELHFLDVSDATCKDRLKKRNESGQHAFQTSDQQFDLFTKHFVKPSENEGFNIITVQVR